MLFSFGCHVSGVLPLCTSAMPSAKGVPSLERCDAGTNKSASPRAHVLDLPISWVLGKFSMVVQGRGCVKAMPSREHGRLRGGARDCGKRVYAGRLLLCCAGVSTSLGCVNGCSLPESFLFTITKVALRPHISFTLCGPRDYHSLVFGTDESTILLSLVLL